MTDDEEHPAHEAIIDILYNIRTAIKGAAVLPAYLEDGLISIPMSREQTIAYEAQIRSLRSVENMIIERYPEAKN